MVDQQGDKANLDLIHTNSVALLTRIYKDLTNNTAASALLEDFIESPSFNFAGVHLNYLKVLNNLLSEKAKQQPESPMTPSVSRDPIDASRVCATLYWAFRIIGKSKVS